MDDFRKLIHDARAGSEEAFAELVKNYVQPLQRALRRSSRPLATAEVPVRYRRVHAICVAESFFAARHFKIDAARLSRHGHRAGAAKAVAVELAVRLADLSGRAVGQHYGISSTA